MAGKDSGQSQTVPLLSLGEETLPYSPLRTICLYIGVCRRTDGPCYLIKFVLVLDCGFIIFQPIVQFLQMDR